MFLIRTVSSELLDDIQQDKTVLINGIQCETVSPAAARP